MLRSLAIVVLSVSLTCAATAQEPKTIRNAAGDSQRAADDAKAAQERLDGVQKAEVAIAAKLQQAAAQVALRTASRGSPERDVVDPQDAIERFALLTSGGPLIVQVEVTIDGQPFRVGREKLVEDMIAGADLDKDGQTTWAEAFSSARFMLGRLGNLNEQVRDGLVRSLDKNKNSLVEAAEARQFLAQFAQGATFSLGGGPSSLRVVVAGVLQPAATDQADLLTLLDTDASKSLDIQELEAATTRLKSRDADDNDLLEKGEISGAPAVGPYRVVDGAPAQPASGALLLGPTATATTLLAALQQKYKPSNGRIDGGCFSQLPQLFASLDKDQSGAIELSEISAFNDVPPQVELAVDLGTQRVGAGLRVASLSAEIRSTADGPEKKVLETEGVRISLSANASAPPARNYDSIARSLLRQFDKDGNGYLEMSEYAGPPTLFALFDENGDGKAYLEEIIAGYARQTAPQLTQVVANVVQQRNSLFETLDTNGDGRLGLREMRAAAQQLATLDKDQDQTIAGNEIPESFSISFALGSGNGPVLERPLTMPGGIGRPASGPQWFIRMDRNGDGDVTLREFLGTEADFKRLDTSGDGLLDPQEARAAK